MKVFVGCYDIASILSGVVEGFKELGHEVTSFVMERNRFYSEAQYDVVKEPFLKHRLRYDQRKIPAVLRAVLNKFDQFFFDLHLRSITDQLIKEHDLFVFIWSPWLSEEYLFPRIKAANKKIVCLHVGSDVRHISAYKQEYNEDVSLWESFFHDEDINEKIKKIRYHELYADALFSVPDQEGLAIRGYNHLHIPLKGIDSINFNIPRNEVPIIVHAPSRTGIKGTSIILETIDRLKREGYHFEFRLLQNLSNAEVKRNLSEADILVDELLLHGPGVLSLEAMAAGCQVLTRAIDQYKDVFCPPVISVKPSNVYERLKITLDNKETASLDKGRQYVLSHNKPAVVVKKIINSLDANMTDYKPNFFLSTYQLPYGIALSKQNRMLTEKILKVYNGFGEEVIKRAVKAGLI